MISINSTSPYMQELFAITPVQATPVFTIQPQVNDVSMLDYNIYFEAKINTSNKVTLTYDNKFFKQSGFKPNPKSEVVKVLLIITEKMEDNINSHGFTKVTISTDYLNTYLTSKYNDNIYPNLPNQVTFSSKDFINSTINKDFTLLDIIHNTNIFTLLPIVKSPNLSAADDIILLIPNFFFLPQIIKIFNFDLLKLVDVAKKNPNSNPMFDVYPIIEMLHEKMLKLHNMFQASTTPKLSYIKFIASFILSNFMFNIYNNTYFSPQRQTASLIMYDITVDILKLHAHNNCTFVSTILQFDDKICVSQNPITISQSCPQCAKCAKCPKCSLGLSSAQCPICSLQSSSTQFSLESSSAQCPICSLKSSSAQCPICSQCSPEKSCSQCSPEKSCSLCSPEKSCPQCPPCPPEKPCVQVAPSNIMLYIFIGISIVLFIILIIILFNQYYNT